MGIGESLEYIENYSEHFIGCSFAWVYMNEILHLWGFLFLVPRYLERKKS